MNKMRIFALIVCAAIILAVIGGICASAIIPDTTDTTDTTVADNATIVDVEAEVSEPVVFYDETAVEVVGCNPEEMGYWMLSDGLYTVNFSDGSSMNLCVDRGSWSWAT